MQRGEIEALVLAVLKDVQETSGKKWMGLSRDATPIGVLDGFDSLTGLEATVLIEERLKAATGLASLGDESLFVDKERALTGKEVSARSATARTIEAR